MTYPIHPGSSFPGSKLGKLPNPVSLAGERRPVQTLHWPFFNSNSDVLAGQRRPVQTSHCSSRITAAWTHEGTHPIYGFVARNPCWIWIRYIPCLAQAQLYVIPKLAMSTQCFYSALDTLAINSPLGHFNGDNAYSPPKKYQTRETTRWL